MKHTDIYAIGVRDIDGTDTTLEPFRGQVLLIVNVASRCGFTPQYEGLEKLFRAHRDRGLVVLGFPCNQFGAQEPGSQEEIKKFCSLRYEVTFPMFAKIDVNGAGAHPLFTLLKSQHKGLLGTKAIKWNFTKFLVGRDGTVLGRYAPQTRPEELEADIARALASTAAPPRDP